MFENKTEVEKILGALAEQLEAIGATSPELVVCGGSALNVLGLVSRTTKDVDVVALAEKNATGAIQLKKSAPLPVVLTDAAARVARDFDLPDDWLNPGPTSVVDFGLPEGLMDRVETRRFSPKLVVHFLSRSDQIHFKLYAAVDQGPGKHYHDLLALQPNAEKLEEAARWSMTHDVSEGYRHSLKGLISQMGFEDVAARL